MAQVGLPFSLEGFTNTMYRSGPLILVLAVEFAAMTDGPNWAGAGAYLGGCMVLFAVLIAAGRAGGTIGGTTTTNDACSILWPTDDNVPTLVAPSTTFYWYTMMYFIAVGTGMGATAGGASDGIIIMTALFMVYDLWLTYYSNRSGAGGELGIMDLIRGRGECWNMVALAFSVLLGTGFGWLWAFAMTAAMKPTGSKPAIACAKESNAKAFRCRVRKRELAV